MIDDSHVSRFESFDIPVLEKLIEILGKEIEQKKIVVYQRLKFRKMEQQKGECADAWLARLRKQIKACRFGDLEDSIPRDQIVACCKSKGLQQLLAEDSLTLHQAMQLARKFDGMDVESSKSSAATHVPKTKEADTKQSEKKSEQVQCSCCGWFGHETCERAKDRICRRCGRVNHFAAACPSWGSGRKKLAPGGKQGSLKRVADAKAPVPMLGIDAATTSGEKFEKETFPVTIDGFKTNVVVDSGAGASAISFNSLVETGFDTQQIRSASVDVFSFGQSSPLELIGEVSLKVRSSDRPRFGLLLWTLIPRPTLLSANASKKIGLLRMGPGKIAHRELVGLSTERSHAWQPKKNSNSDGELASQLENQFMVTARKSIMKSPDGFTRISRRTD